MTRRQKRVRRKAVAEAQGARLDAGTSGISTGKVAFYVTRAVHHGVLRDDVQVWLTKPDRLAVLDDVHWLGTREDGMSSLADTWSLERCAREIGTRPDDARQCIASAPPRASVS